MRMSPAAAAAVLAAVLLAVSVPLSSESEGYSVYSAEGSSFTYETFGNGISDPYRCTLKSVSSSEDTVFLPAALEGYNVTEIGGGAMSGISGSPTVVVPGTVRTVGSSAFPAGSEEIFLGDRPEGDVPEGSAHLPGTSGWGKDSDTIETCTVGSEDGSSVICAVIGGKAMIISGTVSASGSLTVPSSAGGYPVDSIGPYAFGASDSGDNNKVHRTDLKTVSISDGVRLIRERAFFYQGALESVSIPGSVTDIMDEAFRSDGSLESIDLPSSVRRIGFETFRECISLTSITVPDSVTELCDGSFRLCRGAIQITVGVGISEIPAHCFEYGDRLERIALPETLRSVGDSAFYMCPALVSVDLPDGVTSVGDSAFRECTSLENVDFGKSLKYVGSNSFENCRSLCEVSFPASLGNIADSAFWGCTALEHAVFEGDEPEIGSKAFPAAAEIEVRGSGSDDGLPLASVAAAAAIIFAAVMLALYYIRRRGAH